MLRISDIWSGHSGEGSVVDLGPAVGRTLREFRTAAGIVCIPRSAPGGKSEGFLGDTLAVEKSEGNVSCASSFPTQPRRAPGDSPRFLAPPQECF
jgi:hypothetical protein